MTGFIKSVRALTFVGLIVLTPQTASAIVSVGGSFGLSEPFSHRSQMGTAMAFEGFLRGKEWALRYQFTELGKNIFVDVYSVVLGLKWYFLEKDDGFDNWTQWETVRPYVEGAAGPVFVNTTTFTTGWAGGVRPELSIGIDFRLGEDFGCGIANRFAGLFYWGDTLSGDFEANGLYNLLFQLFIGF